MISVKNKSNLIFVIVSIFIIVIICLISVFTSDKKDLDSSEQALLEKATLESNSISNNEKKEFNKISVDEYLKIYGENDPKLVLIGRSDCQYCVIAEPIIQNIMYKNNISINYLSTDNFTEESYNNFRNSNDLLQNFSTPLLMVVGNSEITDSIEGLYDSQEYIKFLKNNGFMK